MSDDHDLDGNWVVTAYRSDEGMVEPDDRTEASMLIEGTVIAGTMGINRFSGSIESDFPIGPLVTTLMAGPSELMQQEDILLEHLQGADTVEIVGDGMFLSGDGLLLMELERTGTDESSPSS